MLGEFAFTPDHDLQPDYRSFRWMEDEVGSCPCCLRGPRYPPSDEPTNHLDVKNVKWLEDYLKKSPCTSHHRISRLRLPRQRVPAHHSLRAIQAQAIPW